MNPAQAGLAREQPKRGGSSMLISDSVRLENALTADMLRAVPMAVNEEVRCAGTTRRQPAMRHATRTSTRDMPTLASLPPKPRVALRGCLGR